MAEKAQPATDSVKLGDGSVMQIARLPEVDESTWGSMKNYLEKNPEIARGLQNFSKNPEAMRGWLQTQAVAEHYQKKLEAGDQKVMDKLKDLENAEELSHVFDDIKCNGISAAMKYWDDEELLLKISQHVGGVPPELSASLGRISITPLSLHDAARNGDLKGVSEYLKKNQPVHAHDIRGIAPLGYAIGSNHIAVTKLLFDSRANPHEVDANGNTGLHYAAGYGRKELTEYLLGLGVDGRKANNQGQTPRMLAALNRHQVCIDLLAEHGITA
mmetsp:Transcript_44062/g.140368  ORF Transcript_44062/g.140368 Transcript_44062/m.140368 type:complete len:272 (-) Transcript_44062:114-929(-)